MSDYYSAEFPFHRTHTDKYFKQIIQPVTSILNNTLQYSLLRGYLQEKGLYALFAHDEDIIACLDDFCTGTLQDTGRINNKRYYRYMNDINHPLLDQQVASSTCNHTSFDCGAWIVASWLEIPKEKIISLAHELQNHLPHLLSPADRDLLDHLLHLYTMSQSGKQDEFVGYIHHLPREEQLYISALYKQHLIGTLTHENNHSLVFSYLPNYQSQGDDSYAMDNIIRQDIPLYRSALQKLFHDLIYLHVLTEIVDQKTERQIIWEQRQSENYQLVAKLIPVEMINTLIDDTSSLSDNTSHDHDENTQHNHRHIANIYHDIQQINSHSRALLLQQARRHSRDIEESILLEAHIQSNRHRACLAGAEKHIQEHYILHHLPTESDITDTTSHPTESILPLENDSRHHQYNCLIGEHPLILTSGRTYALQTSNLLEQQLTDQGIESTVVVASYLNNVLLSLKAKIRKLIGEQKNIHHTQKMKMRELFIQQQVNLGIPEDKIREEVTKGIVAQKEKRKIQKEKFYAHERNKGLTNKDIKRTYFYTYILNDLHRFRDLIVQGGHIHQNILYITHNGTINAVGKIWKYAIPKEVEQRSLFIMPFYKGRLHAKNYIHGEEWCMALEYVRTTTQGFLNKQNITTTKYNQPFSLQSPQSGSTHEFCCRLMDCLHTLRAQNISEYRLLRKLLLAYTQSHVHLIYRYIIDHLRHSPGIMDTSSEGDADG